MTGNIDTVGLKTRINHLNDCIQEERYSLAQGLIVELITQLVGIATKIPVWQLKSDPWKRKDPLEEARAIRSDVNDRTLKGKEAQK